jgi:hypothetical protein
MENRSLIGVATCLASTPAKVIIDTDFNTIGDDGQVAVMAAQLYAQLLKPHKLLRSQLCDWLGGSFGYCHRWQSQMAKREMSVSYIPNALPSDVRVIATTAAKSIRRCCEI